MEWSPVQDKALRDVADWFKNHSREQQVYRLFGYAGTGKTTLAKHFAEGIDGMVKFATFTGKAAHVMAQKGCAGASTIHKLIYIPRMQSKQRLKDLEELLAQEKAKSEPNHELIARVSKDLNQEKENFSRPNFTLNIDSDLRHARLLIIDECSMVDKQMGKDLESFGVPILVLGDPEQLPPVYGAGHFTEKPADILLTEIHRQAKDNPIIEMSRRVREGLPLSLGNYGSSRVVDCNLSEQELIESDMVLVGRRKTKRGCDVRARKILQKEGDLPRKGDRLICVRNHHDLGLLNGQLWTAEADSKDTNEGDVEIFVQNEDDASHQLNLKCAASLFYGVPIDKWDHKDGVEEFEYGYALTVHKAQGSQWNKVILVYEADKFPNFSAADRRRWLYTGITRAAEQVTVIKKA